MSTAENVATTAMIVESSALADHLLDEQTRIEPHVLLERGPGGTSVRKLTVAEKLAHSQQTGVSVFMAGEHEQDEFFALLDRRSER